MIQASDDSESAQLPDVTVKNSVIFDFVIRAPALQAVYGLG